jgi:hypothetical protein
MPEIITDLSDNILHQNKQKSLTRKVGKTVAYCHGHLHLNIQHKEARTYKMQMQHHHNNMFFDLLLCLLHVVYP